MRKAALIAILLLVAACTRETQGAPERIEPIPPRTATSSTPTTTTSAAPTRPPEPGAPVADVIAWIEAGEPADTEQYHVATREGTDTDLGSDVAFVTPSGKSNCMTDSRYSEGALACLVDLKNPPPRPEDAYGEWKGGWVDYDGQSLTVGSVHGDPGRFTAGTGRVLPYGRTLRFGDYACRVDPVGLYCANYAFGSAVRFNDAGIEPFGCLERQTPPPMIGELYRC
ncbi:putative lipoprotein LppI [Mycolicibacterium hassiacum DSM 44199]|jgi:hypothetical protein|uniref:Putative lipoprotein LppI n=1 Tax=Mycolicibacterium hassiacum (strain DSM 44199 / CIP 105218 / JCM 12690 / 3849) TaxID=1122247 RepID=K5BFU5_MYCHD|nr:hypothetical protein [Mycolicibacterium hassiacum]EKF23456.1 putative lipoprotein LppI [Mycolicibacterium hassiacum DSM 44199]MBX5485263.1 hypothetical protein [Mycolicibacterium hassiacum]MDA4084724.1 hypothetical protein [Mycolicibacterium hassiacum DSM 44199]PZN23958.1 MAG: hypothetical protein DIU75_04110 [Mycolicibacterium hassiacum]VCT89945.1 hypothetical protein MHAS_01645 [Mycolicibacterium hassiacum DSM 44199]